MQATLTIAVVVVVGRSCWSGLDPGEVSKVGAAGGRSGAYGWRTKVAHIVAFTGCGD